MKRSPISTIYPRALIATVIAFTAFTQVSFAATAINPQKLIELTNTQRVSHGEAPLVENQTLDRSAFAKAQDMLSRNYFAHSTPDGKTPWTFFDAAGYQYVWAGENLAIDFTNNDPIMTAWMNSPTHEQNILNQHYRDIGIAVVEGSFDGKDTVIVVQHFGATNNIAGDATIRSDTTTAKTWLVAMLEKIRVFFNGLRASANAS